MPQIEELQTSAKANAPGWSYVVDTGYDPSKVAINPTNRKRLRTGQAQSASDLTLRQQTAINRYLAELDKDSHREIQIPIPKPISNKKQTTNAKRILGSGKTFQHYLEEEEARLALKGGAETAPQGPKEQRPSKTPIARRKSALANAESAGVSPAPSSQGGKATPKPVQQPPPSSYPQDSILAIPPAVGITEEEIEKLLDQPMLTYNAAKSAPPKMDGRRPQVFCEICGYWGRAKCMKCGARICGLECRDTHDESRCLKFYA
ncbi:hypothetical protein KVT40_006805 [Elsinoe batatas]|uniref:HIT-type domain-containing protein n=1 Tax=Elsinoe batatas TaxID=2601811 RepID=A0A8K0KW68_9PEZI|nr:hypothetical protein KVT40_006805 [Elsinoe batatas]